MTILNNFKITLNKTKNIFLKKLTVIFNKKIDENIFTELNDLLLESDVGADTTIEIIQKLSKNLKKFTTTNKQIIFKELSLILLNMLKPYEKPLQINLSNNPFSILILGINGAGKTTTTIKLASLYKKQNKKILVVAGDTYRAAGIKQLQTLSDINNINIVKQHYKADSASVVFDAYKIAQKTHTNILIIDTAGRLHTNSNLIIELKKIKNTLQKLNPSAPQEIMLILDATLGQNSLIQAQTFNKHLNITGITITKLDGTAKAGIIFSIAKKTNIPIRYICTGEQLENIEPFNAKIFINTLLNTNFQ